MNKHDRNHPLRTAVVVGGGIGGLCSAAALSKHFARVHLIERDKLAKVEEVRSGVPQGKHAHVLLERGVRELEALFPGFRADLMQAGAINIDWPADIATLSPHGWLRRNTLCRRNNLKLLMSSRILLEGVIRKRIQQIDNILVGAGTEVVGLQAHSGSRIAGVVLQERGTVERRMLDADLVVDASGRRSKVVSWLKAEGFEVPYEEVVDSKLGYASRWFEIDPATWQSDWWWKGMWIDAAPPESLFGGAIFPIENNRLLVTLAGCGDANPPSDEAGFNRYMENLRSPYFAATVQSAKPISTIAAFRDMPNRLRHFHRMKRYAGGILVIGDAVCSLSPIYAQGMSVAAACAAHLDRFLSKTALSDPAFEAKFFRKQAGIISSAWSLATAADFSYPHTEGKRPSFLNLFDPYFSAYSRAMKTDPELNLVFQEVTQMLAPSWRMMTPRMVVNVLRKQGRSAGYFEGNGPDRLPRSDFMNL